LEEADALADRIAILDQGKLVAQGTPDELKRLVPGGHVSLRFADPAGLDAAARALGDVPHDRDLLTLQLPSDGSVRSLRALLDRLDDESLAVDKLSMESPDLDDVFFAFTSRSESEATNGVGNQKVTTS
jgi:ABC-2 type transport system ATP-binding protein